MRVAIDGSALASGRGGDETLMRGILIGLAEVADASWEFDVYTGAESIAPGISASDPRFRFQRISHTGGLARLMVELPLKVRRGGRPDVMVSLTHSPLFLDIPQVLIVTDLSFHRHPEYYPAGARARLNTLVPIQARRAAAVATLSDFCRQDLLDAYGLEPSRVAVIPCGVEPPLPIEGARWAAQEDWARLKGIREPFILYLGNVHPRKNLDRLIQAVAMGRQRSPAMAAHQFVVAGARWWGEQPADSEAASKDDLFLGQVSQEQREFLLRRAAFLAYPSLFEGFGLPPVEAMQRDTPVLASRATAIPEVVGDAALLVDPTDLEEITEGLVRMSEDESLRTRLVELGRTQSAKYTTRASGEAAFGLLSQSVSSDPLAKIA